MWPNTHIQTPNSCDAGKVATTNQWWIAYPPRHLRVFRSLNYALCPDAREKFWKSDYFNILVQKFDLPCFHQLVTRFHGNKNGISIPHFRFSAALCQLRAVNAIWLTARIQNSSILKWQRERKRKCLPSHFAFLPLKRHNFMIVWDIDWQLSDTCNVHWCLFRLSM